MNSTELVRIPVPNLECNCIVFSPDGKTLISGWSDGRIRVFGPETGKLVYVINDAHRVMGQKRVSGHLSGVTALAVSEDNKRIVSGGSDGQIRVWSIGEAQTLISSMKEHKATVNSIMMKKDGTECVSACDDGSCIVWNLQRFVRGNIMYAQTYFKAACYLTDESQILTTGSDKRVSFFIIINIQRLHIGMLLNVVQLEKLMMQNLEKYMHLILLQMVKNLHLEDITNL